MKRHTKNVIKVLTLALVCAIVVTGTSITSEAKGKKSVATIFVDTVLASDGLTVNGQKLTTNQLAAKLKTNDPSLASVSGYTNPDIYNVQGIYDTYFDPESYYRHSQISGYVDGEYYQEDIYNDNPFAGMEDQLQLMRYGSISIVRSDANPDIYALDTSVYSANLDNVGNCNPMAIIWSNTKGYNTAELAANNVNASALAAYMQSNNMISALLGFIIIYNMGILALTEKMYQFATLKVLGFKFKKLALIYTQQNLWLTIVGIIFGLPLGYEFTDCMFKYAIGDNYDFFANIDISSYIIAIIGTLIIMFVTSIALSRNLKNIDMVASLKANE